MWLQSRLSLLGCLSMGGDVVNKINGLRFIIGTSCNYDCFYCHHEGCRNVVDNTDLSYYNYRVKLLYDFCVKNKIYEIAITGGEPFLYIDRLKVLLRYFASKDFHVIINTNASLLCNNFDYINNLQYALEFHVNLSSLTPTIHKQITRKDLFHNEIKSINMLKDTKHVVKLNVICLKTINDKELIEIDKFARNNKCVPRYLVFYDTNCLYSDIFMSVNEICNCFNAKVYKEYSYGIIYAKGNYDIEIVKCLCMNKECAKCKKTTFLHFDPSLNIKYCLNASDIVYTKFDNLETVYDSIIDAYNKLEDI